MTTQITFGTFKIIGSDEGGWQAPQIGMIQPAYQFVGLANADGELAKEVSGKGCQHKLTVTFYNVPVAELSTFHKRMKDLRRQGVQTLHIPEWESIPHCVVETIELQVKRVAVSTSFATGSLVQTAGKNLEYAITFHQLFE